MGGSSKPQVVGNAPTVTKEQSQYINSLVGGLLPDVMSQYKQFLGGPQNYQDLFKQAYIDPAMMAYEQNILPSIKSSFGQAGLSSSSALNQALASSAKDLATTIGSQAGNFYTQQQGVSQNVLQLLNQLAGQKSFEPLIQEGYNPSGDILKMLGQIGGGAAMGFFSSKDYKENILDYHNGLEIVRGLNVKRYNYKKEISSDNSERLGILWEQAPEFLRKKVSDMKTIDVYGLVSLLISAVQQLDEKILELSKEKHGHRI